MEPFGGREQDEVGVVGGDRDVDPTAEPGARLAPGRAAVVEIPAHRVEGPVDPTGAGDSFALLYLDARSRGAEPADAAAHAAKVVAELIARP